MEAGFLEAALLVSEIDAPVAYLFVDEPLPDEYARFRGPEDEALAFGMLLSPEASSRLTLSWAAAAEGPGVEPPGIPASAAQLLTILETGSGQLRTSDGRLEWEWRVD